MPKIIARLAALRLPQVDARTRELAREALLAWGASRVALAAAAYVGVALLRGVVVQWTPPPADGRTLLTSDAWASHWGLWDTLFYVRIATHGYSQAADAAFFPLYPLLIRGGMAFGLPALVAALVVSAASSLAAVWLLGLLAVEEGVFADARYAMRALLAFPPALFLLLAYSDGLFLALACGVFLVLRRQRWTLAALLLFACGLTRPTAALLILPAVFEVSRAHGWWGDLWRKRRPKVTRLALLHLADVALAAPAAFLVIGGIGSVVYHDPLAALHAEHRVFSHAFTPPWQTLILSAQQLAGAPSTFAQARILLDLVPFLLVAVVTLVGLRRLPALYGIYGVSLLLLILCSPIVGALFPLALVSAGRYSLAAIPAWLLLGRALRRSPQLETLYLATGFAVQALALAFLLSGGWLV